MIHSVAGYLEDMYFEPDMEYEENRKHVIVDEDGYLTQFPKEVSHPQGMCRVIAQ